MYDINVEKMTLAYIVIRNEELDIQEEDFIDKKNREIAKAILELKRNKKEIDIFSVSEKMQGNKTDSLDYVISLGEELYGIPVEVAYKRLKNNSKRRKLKREAEKIVREIEDIDDIDEFTEKEIKELKEISKDGTIEKEKMVDRIIKTMENIEKNYKSQEDYRLYTGFFDLDSLTSGLHKKELTVVGARPAVGKTTFALQIAHKIAERGVEVAYFSLEMSDIQMITKILSMKTGINTSKMRSGTLEETDFEKIAKQCGELSELHLNIITECYTIQDIELEIRRLKNNQNVELIVIDYLQLIKNNNKKYNNREQELADISRTLKILTLELDIPIIALCQLNRNASKSEPTLAYIRESGAIEQDADNVIFLYRQNEATINENVQDIVVDLQKQRSGSTGTVILRFIKGISEFRNLVK